MKFRILIALALVGFLMSGPVSAQNRSHLHKILESGVLRVGTTGDWNPMTLRDPVTNSYRGFDIDVADWVRRNFNRSDQGKKFVRGTDPLRRKTSRSINGISIRSLPVLDMLPCRIGSLRRMR